MEEKIYWVLAYYHFTEIADPHACVEEHKNFLEKLDASARIYISEEGINGQSCLEKEDAKRYIKWMSEHPYFSSMKFKIQEDKEPVFPRLTVKYRKQLVAIDCPCDPKEGGEHVSPKRWREMLESDEDYLVLDVRNDYEWDIGHFVGAERPQFKTFREFPDYADSLTKEHNPKETKVMMYCTGGIRCELFSDLLKKKGFSDVYQLDGGVINYGEKEQGKHWKGKLFVFDDRLTVPVNTEEEEVVGKCKHCGSEAEHIYNCANMDCNALFISCPTCRKELLGCCQEECVQSAHRRPFQEDSHKPFRRMHHYQNLEENV